MLSLPDVPVTRRQRPVSSIVLVFHGNANRFAYGVKRAFYLAGPRASGSPSSDTPVHPLCALRDAAEFANQLQLFDLPRLAWVAAPDF